MSCEHTIHKLIMGQKLIKDVYDDRKPCPECGKMLSITLLRSATDKIVSGLDAVWIDVKEADTNND